MLLVSIVLMLAGVIRTGWRATGLVAAGSILLVVNMFMRTSVSAAAGLLGAGYLLVLLGYVVAWRSGQRSSLRSIGSIGI